MQCHKIVEYQEVFFFFLNTLWQKGNKKYQPLNTKCNLNILKAALNKINASVTVCSSRNPNLNTEIQQLK